MKPIIVGVPPILRQTHVHQSQYFPKLALPPNWKPLFRMTTNLLGIPYSEKHPHMFSSLNPYAAVSFDHMERPHSPDLSPLGCTRAKVARARVNQCVFLFSELFHAHIDSQTKADSVSSSSKEVLVELPLKHGCASKLGTPPNAQCSFQFHLGQNQDRAFSCSG